MQRQTPDALRGWFKAVEPVCAELFNAAYVMCGNYDMAEYALNCAILDVWRQGFSAGLGFRERLRGALRSEAFAAALSDEGIAAEFTWPGIEGVDGDDPVLDQLARERVALQRLVILRHGCGLSHRSIAQLTELSQGQARAELRRFEARCRRRLDSGERSKAEGMIARQAKRLLARRGPGTPHPAQVYRAFEAEAMGLQDGGQRVSRALGALLTALMALVCAGAFWLFAVLVRAR